MIIIGEDNEKDVENEDTSNQNNNSTENNKQDEVIDNNEKENSKEDAIQPTNKEENQTKELIKIIKDVKEESKSTVSMLDTNNSELKTTNLENKGEASDIEKVSVQTNKVQVENTENRIVETGLNKLPRTGNDYFEIKLILFNSLVFIIFIIFIKLKRKRQTNNKSVISGKL